MTRTHTLTKALTFAATLFAVSAISTAASAVTINYSSNPGNIQDSDMWIEGTASSGTFDLTPGVAQIEIVWAWDLFGNPFQTFSNKAVDLGLTLNGVTETIPFLVSAAQGSGVYSFIANGTVKFTISGIGVIDVTGINDITYLVDPSHAGPIDVTLLLEPTATVTGAPEPATLALVGTSLAGLAARRRRRRSRGADGEDVHKN